MITLQQATTLRNLILQSGASLRASIAIALRSNSTDDEIADSVDKMMFDADTANNYITSLTAPPTKPTPLLELINTYSEQMFEAGKSACTNDTEQFKDNLATAEITANQIREAISKDKDSSHDSV